MNKYLVESLGTLFFLYVILATGNWLAIGAALAIAVLIGGPISGGMFNPAVSVMMVSAGKLPKSDLIPYVLAQIAGGLAALIACLVEVGPVKAKIASRSKDGCNASATKSIQMSKFSCSPA